MKKLVTLAITICSLNALDNIENLKRTEDNFAQCSSDLPPLEYPKIEWRGMVSDILQTCDTYQQRIGVWLATHVVPSAKEKYQELDSLYPRTVSAVSAAVITLAMVKCNPKILRNKFRRMILAESEATQLSRAIQRATEKALKEHFDKK